MPKSITSIGQKVAQLEDASVSTLLDFLAQPEPNKVDLEKARVAHASFSGVQRRRSAMNAEAALYYMMNRDGVAPRLTLAEASDA